MGTLAEQVGDTHEELALARVAARGDPFQVLVACVVSLRTRDEVTGPASARLLGAAPDARTLAGLEPEAIADLIRPCSFFNVKGRSLRAMAQALLDDHDGVAPDDIDALCALPGVGRKTANLVVTLGYGSPGICVDTHVHRMCNRLGWVDTRGADATELQLRRWLPERWWIPTNDLMVVWGRTVCTPISPRCGGCAVAHRCPRVGVTTSR